MHRVNFILQHAWLMNYKPHDIAGGNQKYYRVDTARRRQTVAGWSRVHPLPLILFALAVLVPSGLILVKVFRTE